MKTNMSICAHNSQTCNDGGENSIMLFGVQITQGTNNNNNNNNNHSQYQQPPPQVSTSIDATNVYDNVVHASAGSHEYKRFNEGSWTEEEHKRFMIGLKDKGKGNWKAISEDFVKTRTPTQVATHAQKYYLFCSNQNHRRNGKTSIFELTIDPDVESSTIMEDEQIRQKTAVPLLPPPTPTAYQSTQNGGSPLPICLGPIPLSVWPLSSVDLNDNGASSIEIFPLSLKLQSSPPSYDHSSPSTLSPAFNSMSPEKSSGGSGDNISRVA